MTDWPHQQYAVRETARLIGEGARRICIASPTGAGKSRIMRRLLERYGSGTVYANRIMLVDQLSEGLTEAGISCGVQSSGYAPDIDADVQVASIQTVHPRWKKQDMALHKGNLCIVDEIHNEKSKRCQEVVQGHLDRGEAFVGFTATPVGIGHMFDELIQAGTTSELRKCGALVPALTYAPDEPTMKSFKGKTKGLLQLREEHKEVMLSVVVGRVIEHHRRLNPDRRPAILFAPGVAESKWFCDQLNKEGFRAAHIDADKIVIGQETMPSTRETRKQLKDASACGDVEIVCNRFVLREGVDWPHLWHGIFACTFGSVATYLQAGGRLLRNHPDLEDVIIQDHGGNWWRHDSLNADRQWSLEDTDQILAKRHEETYRTKAKAEPITCPKCSKVRKGGLQCPGCGFTARGKVRTVIQTDGTLRRVQGDVYRPRKVNNAPDAHKKWKACVFRCKATGRTFAQARALFMYENRGTVPDASFPCFPTRDADWFQKVSQVPFSRLTGYESKVGSEAAARSV